MIFFDAAGTLIEVRGRVGDIYAMIAAEFGIALDPAALEAAFAVSLRQQQPMICPGAAEGEELGRCERGWWRRLVGEVVGEARREARFDDFFLALFEHFRSADAWAVYPEVEPALAQLRQRGERLAIISNFDSRLDDLLADLGLRDYFDAVHLSTRLGAAKPDRAIFRAALAHHQVEAAVAWHVGDSLREDVEGAIGAGLRAIWLDRTGAPSQNDRLIRITRLDQILDLTPGIA